MGTQAGYKLPPERVAAVDAAMRQAAAQRSHVYPWSTLETSTISCIGYGSLVNSASAARTLGPGIHPPVIAFGVRRLFNYEIDERASRYGPPSEPAARAALNVVVTGRSTDMVNGVQFDVTPDGVPALRERERGYDLVPVACLPWDRRDAAAFVAYVLRCPEEARAGKVRVNPNIEPHYAYYRLCREGAASHGDDFLRFWLATTYLADGTTPVTEWEQRRPGSAVQAPSRP